MSLPDVVIAVVLRIAGSCTPPCNHCITGLGYPYEVQRSADDVPSFKTLSVGPVVILGRTVNNEKHFITGKISGHVDNDTSKFFYGTKCVTMRKAKQKELHN